MYTNMNKYTILNFFKTKYIVNFLNIKSLRSPTSDNYQSILLKNSQSEASFLMNGASKAPLFAAIFSPKWHNSAENRKHEETTTSPP